MAIKDMLLPEFDHEMTTTRKFLERVPEGKADWRPHPKSMPLGRLAGHVAELAGWAAVTLTSDSLDFNPPGGTLGVYLRLNDVAVPASYGPSGDEGSL